MKGILFNDEMVRAILDGRKTVTRRVVKSISNYDEWYSENDCRKHEYGAQVPCYIARKIATEEVGIYYPNYDVGDVLYVRETWRVGAWNENGGLIAVDYLADGHSPKQWIQVDSEAFEKYWVQSTDDAIAAGIKPNKDGEYNWERGKGPTRWRPSIHMPKEAARIFLKVTAVRVERLQDITPEQADKEGVGNLFMTNIANSDIDDGYNIPLDSEYGVAKEQFAYLWDSTVKKSDLDQFGWDANPWVWVIEFERCEKEVE